MPPKDTSFTQSLQSLKDQEYSLHLVVLRHPNHHIMEATDPFIDPSSPKNPNASDPFKAWRSPDFPWMGTALWIIPKHFATDLMKAHCGSLAAFTHTSDTKSDLAYVHHLGEWGCQIGSSAHNSQAFSGQLKMDISVALCDLRVTRGTPAVGSKRPNHWPEPLPLMKQQWNPEEGPPHAPDFSAAALAHMNTIRNGVQQAMLEEGVPKDIITKTAGLILSVPASIVVPFAREEHPMFGSKLSLDDQKTTNELFNFIKAAVEQNDLDQSTPKVLNSSLARPTPRI